MMINNYPYQIFLTKNDARPCQWLLLHGFMGSHHDFDDIKLDLPGEVLTVDLLGFGSRVPDVVDVSRFKMANQIDDLRSILVSLHWQNVNLLGYSMGGRLAVGFALMYPNLVKNLYLESTTAGLKTVSERQARITADEIKAQAILENFPKFVDNWAQLPLFETQQLLSSSKKDHIRQQRLSQNPTNVANSLRKMGTGAQPDFWSKLSDLEIPTQVIVGELDNKFNAIANQMVQLIPNVQKAVIPNAGHNTHVEQPKLFVEALNVSN